MLALTSPTPFQFEGRNVRLVEIDGEQWFVATDIARELGYAEAKDLTRSLDEDEKGRHVMPTLGGDQEIAVISEPGVYRAIVQRRANKKHDDSLTAKIARFQRFVFHDVLPQIGRTGSYSSAPIAPALPDFTSPAVAARAWAEQFEARATAEAQVAQQRTEIATLAPRADAFDRFMDAPGLYGFQAAGRALGCMPNKFTKWLRDEGYIWDSSEGLVGRSRFVTQGLFTARPVPTQSSRGRVQGFVTPKGLNYFSLLVPDSIKPLKSQPVPALPAAATAH